MTFLPNTVYHQEFQDGTRVYFLAVSQFKNGRWNGYTTHGRHKPVKAMGDPTIPSWVVTPTVDIPPKLARVMN